MKLNLPERDNWKLAAVVSTVEEDEALEQLLKCANITAVDRMGYSDHGPVHAKIVANMALKILRLLIARGVAPSLVKNYAADGLDGDDAEVVVVLGAYLHDVGMIVHREKHDIYGIAVAQPVLERLLASYSVRHRVILTAEILHAMTFHDSDVPPLTVEGGVVRVADGLDMAGGRARIPFEIGQKGIHAVSALAIEQVSVQEGGPGQAPVQIHIRMSNSAGIFQVDELLRRKIQVSGLADHFHVTAEITGAEKGILDRIEF
jgi:metal-dependent HD superfamily phosphatase/phosphodiesterase